MLLLDKFIEQTELRPILINFDKEIWKITEKYWNTGFPSNFVNETIPNFKKETEQAIIPEWIFEEKNTFTVRLPYSSANEKLPYSSANEKFSKLFVIKIEDHTNGIIKLVITWNTCEIQSLFN